MDTDFERDKNVRRCDVSNRREDELKRRIVVELTLLEIYGVDRSTELDMTDIGRARVCVCLCARVLPCDVALAFEELVRCRGSDRPARGVPEKERRREVCVGVCV